MTEANNNSENGTAADKENKKGKNIVLCGLSGCGKSILGKRLAMSIGFGFIDLDDWIVRTRKDSVANIIAKSGLDYFRSQEIIALQELEQVKNYVIALGGGTLTQDKAYYLANQIGTVIWLNVPTKELAFRLVKEGNAGLSKRPLMQKDNSDEPFIGDDHAKCWSQIESVLNKQLESREANFVKVGRRLNINYASEDVSLQSMLWYLREERLVM